MIACHETVSAIRIKTNIVVQQITPIACGVLPMKIEMLHVQNILKCVLGSRCRGDEWLEIVVIVVVVVPACTFVRTFVRTSGSKLGERNPA